MEKKEKKPKRKMKATITQKLSYATAIKNGLISSQRINVLRFLSTQTEPLNSRDVADKMIYERSDIGRCLNNLENADVIRSVVKKSRHTGKLVKHYYYNEAGAEKAQLKAIIKR